MKLPISFSPVAMALLIGASLAPALAQKTDGPPTAPPFITVSGNGQVEAVPDQAIVRIGIVRQASSAKDAQDEASKIGQAILKAIGSLGVPAQRIQTSRLTISPVYGQQRPGNEAPRITGYMASNSVAVTLDNLALIGPVVDAGLDNGANQLEGVQFLLKNDGPVREQALRQAVTEAKGKAAAIADVLLVNLGPVLEVAESGVSVISPEVPNEVGFALTARAANPTPVSAGQLEIRAGVVLKYAIVPKN